MAFEAGCVEISNALLNFAQKQSKDVMGQETSCRKTALHIAIEQDRVDLVMLLDSFGHNIHQRFSSQKVIVALIILAAMLFIVVAI